MTLRHFCAAFVAIAIAYVATTSFGSCTIRECLEASCWAIVTITPGAPNSTAYSETDLGTARKVLGNGGNGNPTDVDPVIACQKRSANPGTLQCTPPVAGSHRANNCVSIGGAWHPDGNKKYCKVGTGG